MAPAQELGSGEGCCNSKTFFGAKIEVVRNSQRIGRWVRQPLCGTVSYKRETGRPSDPPESPPMVGRTCVLTKHFKVERSYRCAQGAWGCFVHLFLDQMCLRTFFIDPSKKMNNFLKIKFQDYLLARYSSVLWCQPCADEQDLLPGGGPPPCKDLRQLVVSSPFGLVSCMNPQTCLETVKDDKSMHRFLDTYQGC